MHQQAMNGFGIGSRRAIALVLAAGLVGVAAGRTYAQTTQATPAKAEVTPVARTTGDARRDNMIKMMKPVSIEFKDQRLEDVMNYITAVTQADLEILWLDDRAASGLDKDKTITLKFANGSALSLLEKVLEKASDDIGGNANTWQMSESGAMQIGPRDRLNMWKRTKVYPISDLLTDLPNFTNAPTFDLQQALQSKRGGGGGQAPFQQQNNTNQQTTRPLQERMDELRKIITELVERDQWVDNGGSGASIQYFQGAFLVNAPDYVHRGIDGYDWWPAESTTMTTVKGRRYVSLSIDSAIAKTAGIRKVPVTGVAGGGNGPGSNGPGSGGGSTAPANPPAGPK